MIISGAEFGHFACLGCLRMFSYDRFKFLTIASIEVQYGTSKLLLKVAAIVQGFL